MTKIMLVEDDKSLREIYSIRLAAEGYSIALAGDGEEALSVVVQEKPDLIIADVMMPKISGFDMLDILRSQPETKNIKVIMMTALSSDDQRQRSEALGAAKHLVKSQVGIEDVINAVHEVLGDAPNSNAQANINTAKAISDIENKPTTPVASTNSTVVEPAAGQNVPSAPAAPQGPLATPQQPTGDPSVNFNFAPAAQAAQFAQPAVGAVNPGYAPVAPVVPPTTPPVAMPMQGTLPPNTFNMPPNDISPNAAQVMQQANLQAIQSLYAQMSTQNSTLKPADRILPNAQVAAVAAMQAQQMAAAPSPTPVPLPQTGMPSTPLPSLAPNSAPVAGPPEEKKERGASERIIQPIHDTFGDERRDEMQKRMVEILGGDFDDAPTTINSRTARHTHVEKSAPAKEQADKKESAQKADTAQTVQQSMPQTADATSQAVQEAVAQSSAKPEEPTQTTQEEFSPVQAALEAQEQAGEVSASDDLTDLSKITIDTKIPSIDEIEDPGINETVKAAVPGYLSNLANDLSSDIASGETSQTLAATLINAELAADEVTQVAQEKAKIEAAARKAAEEDLIKNPARQINVQTNTGPNIHTTAVNPITPEAKPAPATPPATPAAATPAPTAAAEPAPAPAPATPQNPGTPS